MVRPPSGCRIFRLAMLALLVRRVFFHMVRLRIIHTHIQALVLLLQTIVRVRRRTRWQPILLCLTLRKAGRKTWRLVLEF